jgi:hypothetical protein
MIGFLIVGGGIVFLFLFGGGGLVLNLKCKMGVSYTS